MGRRADVTGQRFGRLVAVSSLRSSPHGNRIWRCQCDCGRTSEVLVSNLLSGHTTTCGCAYARHGHVSAGKKSRTYRSWQAMIERCTRGTCPEYKRYGAKGITICERWRVFVNFLSDMGERPVGTSLDRIDNDRGYEPGNCRWATRSAQDRNTKRNHWVVVNGERMVLTDAARRLGVHSSTLAERLRKGTASEWNAHEG